MKKALDTIDERLEKRERIEQEVCERFSSIEGFTSEAIAWAIDDAMRIYDKNSELTFRNMRDTMFEAAYRFKLKKWAFSD